MIKFIGDSKYQYCYIEVIDKMDFYKFINHQHRKNTTEARAIHGPHVLTLVSVQVRIPKRHDCVM